jgi:hypothetical protein
VSRLAADAKGRELDSVSEQLKQRADSLVRELEHKAGDFAGTTSCALFLSQFVLLFSIN